MSRQLLGAAAVCVLLFFCAVAKSERTVAELHQEQTAYKANVLQLQIYVQHLESEVANLLNLSGGQTAKLKKMQSLAENQHYDDNFCEGIANSIYTTSRKYSHQVEDSFVEKLDDMQDKQMLNLKKILDKRSCQQAAATGLSSEALSEITGKIDELEQQLTNYEAQQTNFQLQNDEQMKILQEINAKLTQHQEQFDKFEKEIPNTMQPQKNSSGADKKNYLRMQMILGMTQNQNKAKSQ